MEQILYPSYSNVRYRMEQTMRWFGPNDSVSLADIKQAGCTGVVSALHHVLVGEVWTVEEINIRKELIEAAGMVWTVVESVPVHEAIKTRTEGFEQYILNYQQTIRNLSECGIKNVTYNFMPVLDWTRTDLNFQLADGSKTIRFEMAALTAFDIFLLKRKNARNDYDSVTNKRAEKLMSSMNESEVNLLVQNMLKGLPGSDEGFTMEQFKKALATYDTIDRDQLQKNLIYFLKNIVPVAEDSGVVMSIHPDDPPFAVLGLPRVVTCAKDIEDLIAAVPSLHNGLCFCTGSFGVLAGNDLPAMVRDFAERIHFIHLRSTRRNEKGDFFEDNHLQGNVDMYAVIRELVIVMQGRKCSIPVRPDHGHQILDDLKKVTYPGYPAIGRLRGLAEIRGLELGILRSLQEEKL
ncbi:mannonate dehydratase [Daejeonella rubra]|uniref:Mannonate dehydratase n=1 Tax=Daejeonella rubra TaxID=990371 RepID=A0A1G9VJ70_9SPHI|nr:mannonate dehydratase [Daejeonella rubra]SDM72137.1 mannonate dehydratase [Daejeonella rubra]